MELSKTLVLNSPDLETTGILFEPGHFLTVVNGEDEGRLVELSREPVVIGRSRRADFRLTGRGLSGHHCRISLVSGRLLVEDLESTNGVFVNGRRVQGAELVSVGSELRLGAVRLRHELRDVQGVRRQERLDDELRKAADYVQALLPEEVPHGKVSVRWRLVPSAKLGGDAFGYHWLDEDHLAIYLLDVSGHGPGAALHSASVMNVLRSRTLVDTDFSQPSQVLAALNDAFQMDDHGDLFLTLWYGVYEVSTRTLEYASAGHPPALLRDGRTGDVTELPAYGVGIGITPIARYRQYRRPVARGSSLLLYSDGVIEIPVRGGGLWSLAGFRELVSELPADAPPDPVVIEQRVRGLMAADRFEDDVSLLVATFA